MFELLRAQSAPIMVVLNDLEIQIKKSHMMKCPFHDDNTPSLKIYTDTNRGWCFTCKRLYGPVDFVKRFKKLDTTSAITFVIDKYNPAEVSIEVSDEPAPSLGYLAKKLPFRKRTQFLDSATELAFQLSQGSLSEIEYKYFLMEKWNSHKSHLS